MTFFKRIFTLYRSAFSGLSTPVWLLSTVMLINRAGTMVIPFMSLYLTTTFKYSLQSVSLVLGASGLGAILGSWGGGVLTTKFGYRRVMFWSLVLGGVMFFVLMHLQSLLWLCIGAFCLSAFGDAYRPANSVAVSAFSQQETRTRAFTLQRLAINLGWAVGPALGGFLAVHAGYHYLFLVDGVTNISAAFALWWLLGKYKQPSEVHTPDTSATIVNEEKSTNAYKDRFFLWYLAFGLLNALVFMQLFNNIPVFMKTEGGIREDLFGAAMAANGLVIALTEMPLVYLMERRFAVMRLISTGFIVIGLSFAILWIFPVNAYLLWLFVLINTVGEMICLPFFMSHIMNRVPSESRGEYMGMLGMMWSVAQVASPALGASLATYAGYQYTWMTMALMSVLAGMGIWRLQQKPSEVLA